LALVLQCYLQGVEEVGLFDPADPRCKGSTNLRKVKIYPTAQRKFPEDFNSVVLDLFVVLLLLSKQIPG
jgi:hypothetical protein